MRLDVILSDTSDDVKPTRDEQAAGPDKDRRSPTRVPKVPRPLRYRSGVDGPHAL